MKRVTALLPLLLLLLTRSEAVYAAPLSLQNGWGPSIFTGPLAAGLLLLAGAGASRRARSGQSGRVVGAGLTSLVMLASLVPSTARAEGGVLEINQVCATQTGCFPGDAAGLPVTISASGAYRLTGNLVVPDENTDGILVSAHDVAIDLSGFAILRAPCVGVTTSCIPPVAGTGSGVDITSGSLYGLRLRNGAVVGMGSHGVVLPNGSSVTDLEARWNRGIGITVSPNSVVTRSSALNNVGIGISGGVSASVSDSMAAGNGDDGISLSTGGTASGNIAQNNVGDGLSVGSGCLVERNTVRSNQGFGLVIGTNAGYRGNVFSNNTLGSVSGALALDLGGNACGGSSICP